MTEYARVEGSTVIERREIASIPPHKAHLWCPVVYEGSGPLSEVHIEADRVRVVRSEIPLDQLKTALKRKIDEAAETVRLRYLSPGAGMSLTYREKFAQAQAVVGMDAAAANALTEAERLAAFPTLAASVGIEGATLHECAQLVVTKFSEFAALSYVVERTRLAGKKAVDDAQDNASAIAAEEAVTWTV